PDYGGTTPRPPKGGFAPVRVQPPRPCRQGEGEELGRRAAPAQKGGTGEGGGRGGPRAFWWDYGTPPRGRGCGRDVWGVPNSELAIIDTSYVSERRLRLLEDGGVALRLKIATGQPAAQRMPLLRSVARRPHDTGENWVDAHVWGSVDEGKIGPND